MPRLGHVACPGTERDACPTSGRRCKQHMSRTHGRQRDRAVFRGGDGTPRSAIPCGVAHVGTDFVPMLTTSRARGVGSAAKRASKRCWGGGGNGPRGGSILCAKTKGATIVRRPSRGWVLAAILLGLVAVLGLAACGDDDDSSADTSSTASAEITLRLGYVTTADHPYGVAVNQFIKDVSTASGGKIAIEGLAELPRRRRAAAAGRQGRRRRDGVGVLGGVGHPGGHLLRRPAGPRPDHPLRPREGGHRRVRSARACSAAPRRPACTGSPSTRAACASRWAPRSR